MGASQKTTRVLTLPILLPLPQDILVEILSKLPAKSLLRLKCVSKFFCALIAEHGFGVLHRTLSLTLPSRAAILISIIPVTWLSCRLPPAYYTINFSEENPRRPGMLQANRLSYLDSEPFLKGCLRSSSDGLICVSTPNGDVVVCNVSTGQRIFLPRIQFHSPHPPSTSALLGFDSQSKRYKVLMSAKMIDPGFEYKHWILTVGVDKSWREINFSYFHPFFPSDYYLCDNSVYGIIYFYNWMTKDDPTRFHILAFEFGSESYSLIPFPAGVSSQYCCSNYVLGSLALLQVDGGQLAIVFVHKRGHLCYLDVSTWEKSKECWEKITMIIPLEESRAIQQSVCCTTNHVGEIVLLCKNSERFSILICNLKSEVWRQFDVGGVKEFPFFCPTDVKMYMTRDNVFSLE